jgi:hypothetical protein
MPIIQLSFPNPLNTSVQIGDVAYFSNPVPVGTTGNPNGGQWASTVTPHLTSDQSDIIKIGEITNIIQWDGTNSFIECDMPQNLFNNYFADLESGSFIMFSKDNKANLSNILGYYANVTLKNDSLDKAELFNVGTDVFESSK